MNQKYFHLSADLTVGKVTYKANTSYKIVSSLIPTLLVMSDNGRAFLTPAPVDFASAKSSKKEDETVTSKTKVHGSKRPELA